MPKDSGKRIYDAAHHWTQWVVSGTFRLLPKPLIVTRSLEQIVYLIESITADIIYVAEAKDIRHGKNKLAVKKGNGVASTQNTQLKCI